MFNAAQSAYQAVLNRDYRRERLQATVMYEQLIPRGALVFDVGANKGEYASLFKRLGARVVLVEPNPDLAARLRLRYRRFPVVECAVGAKPGTATLHLGTDTNYSTIAEHWRPVVERRGRLSGDAVTVDVRTLDSLIAEHGRPDFIKLDVEGSELAALDGLSLAPPALQFEYQRPLMEDLTACVARIQQLGDYTFSSANDGTFEWWSGSELVTQLREGVAGSGDVFARYESQ
jgi:FkbM family methyltransferase